MTAVTAASAARVFLWAAAGYGLLGWLVCVLASLMTGDRYLLRAGAGLLVIGAVAIAGLRVTRGGRMRA